MPYYVSSGVTSYGVVLNDDFMYVSSRGTANNTTVGNCAVMYVSRGGVAINTSVTGSGKVYVSGYYSSGEYIPGYYDYVEGGSMFVYSGGTANNTTINDWGNMYVESGGTANGVTVKDGAYLVVGSGGTATNISWIPGLGDVDWEIADYVTFTNDISGVFYTRGCEPAGHYYEEFPSVSGSGYLVSSGPVLSSIKVTTKRDGNKRWVDELNVMSGGTAVDITVDDDAFLFVHSGGTVVNLSVDPGAFVRIESGAKLTGRITFLFEEEPLSYFNSFFYVWDETTVDFDLTCTRAGAPSLVNYLGFFSDDFGYSSYGDYQDGGSLHYYGNYTLTVAGNQANGTYNLAGAATGFNKTITVVDKNSGAYLGELNVGETAMINGKAYTLILSGSDLAVTIGAAVVDTTAPQISLISGSPTTSTTGTVTVTATFTDNVAVAATYYKLGENGSWRTYSNSVTVSDNVIVSFKAVDKAGNESNVYSYFVSNIVKPKPVQPTASADITSTTNRTVTVTASFGSDSSQRQYSLDGQNWSTYSSGIRFTQNGTVYFRGISPAGIASDVTAFTVSNIDKVAPQITLISGSPTTTTTGSVTVTATFTDNDAVAATYYKLGENGSWRVCPGSATVTENVIVSFKAVDRAGNESNIYSYVVNNIKSNIISGVVLNSGSRTVSAGQIYTDTTLNAADLNVSSGGAANSTTLSASGYSYSHLNVSSGGTANETTVGSKGCLNVSSGGMANSTTVNSGGYMYVSSGGSAMSIRENGGYIEIEDGANVTFVSNAFSGLAAWEYAHITIHSGTTANSTTVYSVGRLYVSSGGTANITTVNSGGRMFVSSGGTANSTTVNSDGCLYVSSGGTANCNAVNRGNLDVYGGGMANSTALNDWGSMCVASGGTANSTMLSDGGHLYVSSGGTANNTTINDSGSFILFGGGTASRATINSGGYLEIESGGVTNSTTVRGELYLSSGATATNIDWTPCAGSVWIEDGAYATFVSRYSGVYYGSDNQLLSHATVMDSKAVSGYQCSMYVMSGGTATGTTVNEARLKVSSGGVAAGIMVNTDGCLNVSSGGIATGVTVNSDGYLSIENGGIATGATVNEGGWLNVFSGGTAISPTLNDGGYLFISSGATATNIDWTPCAGSVWIEDGAYTTFASRHSGVYYGSENRLLSHAMVLESKGISGYQCSMYVMSGGTANSTTVNEGFLLVSSGGVANSTTFDSGGNMAVYGGTANNTTFNSGGSMVVDGGTANGTTLNSGVWFHVSSGGVANSTTLNSCSLIVSGGTANSTTVNSGGRLRVYSGGTANNTMVNFGYYYIMVNSYDGLTVFSGGVANSTTLNSDGWLIVSGGGTANCTTVSSGGWLNVSSGGTATNIDWTPCVGRISIDESAYVTFVSQYSGVYYGSANQLLSHAAVMETKTVSSGSMYIMSGGTANSTIMSDGYMYVSGGGTANSTIMSGGYMYVCSAGTANNTTVNSGGWLSVSSGGTANNTTINSGGWISISSGGAANNTTINSGGWISFFRGGTANNTTVNSGGWLSVSSGGVANYTTVASDGYLYISGGGGTANNTTVNSGGYLHVSRGGTANNTSVSFGYLYVSSGGKLTGRTQTGDGANISACNGAILDFDISDLAPGSEARIDDMSTISGWTGAIFTLTVGGSQTNGTYRLAGNAAGFNKTISVVNTSGTQLGTLTVGQTTSIGGVDYTLNLNGGSLTVSVSGSSPDPGPVLAPEKLPVFTGDFIGNGKSLLAVKDEPVIRIYRNRGTVLSELTLADGWDVAGVGDFNGDGADDILRVHSSGLVIGEMSEGDGEFSPQVLNSRSEGWSILGTGDFNHNGKDDVLIANPTGASSMVGLLGYWESGVTWTLINGYSAEWECVATGDFNGDGKCDMLWRNSFVGDGGGTYNAYCTWIVDPPAGQNDWRMVSVSNPSEWDFLCAGDFDGNGSHDIAMINGEGVVGIWGVADGYLNSWSILSAVDPSSWGLAGVGDFNGDGTDDIAWRNTETGLTGYWQINDKALTTWANLATIS